MNKEQYEVRDFHTKFKLYIGEEPHIPPPEVVKIRKALIEEEVVKELFPAMDNNDLEEIADGIADSIYVLLGCAISYGIDMEPIWNAVHKSNMLKEGGGKRSDGKILKPKGWKHPDIQSLLDQQLKK